MATTRSVSVELLDNIAIDDANGPILAHNPATVGLRGGGFFTAVDDDESGGITYEFANAAGSETGGGSTFNGSDPSVARLSTVNPTVAIAYTTSSGQIVVDRQTADIFLGSVTIGTGSDADIATADGIPGYAVAWDPSGGKISLAIAAADDSTSFTFVDITNGNQAYNDPSVARLNNGNYVVAWSQYGVAGGSSIAYAVYDSNGGVVTAPTFLDNPSSDCTNPSVAASGDGFTISYEDNEATDTVALFTQSADGRNVSYRQYDAPFSGTARDPDTATVGSLYATAFTDNQLDGEDIRGQDLYLGLSEVGTGTVLTDPDNLVHIAVDGSQASVSAIPEGDTGRIIISYYDRFGGEVHQQLARVRENITGDASDQTLFGKYGVAVGIDGGGGADDLFGGSGDDRLLGNTGNDDISAGLGDDVIDGGSGTDTLYVGGNAPVTIDLTKTGAQVTGNGTKTIRGIENIVGVSTSSETLIGNDQANIFDGGGVNPVLTGLDTFVGNGGNDTYIVNRTNTIVRETSASGGTDLVKSQAASFTLPTNVENLTLLAEAGDAKATGNGLVNFLTGNNGANILDGKAGADTMIGYAGIDTFYVDNAGDRVIEAANGGTADRVLSNVNYVLGAGQEVEILATTSPSATGAINLTGNEKVQALYGNNGANILDGKAGADSMIGYAGNDTYYVDNAGDRALEAANGGTADRVLASVNYTLGAGQEIETLGTTNGAGTAAINLTGNDKAQMLLGSNGANILDGKAGADIMRGYAAKDSFAFTTALGSTNVDHIVDFSVPDDTIRLENAIFTALGTGALSSAAFKDLGVTGANVDTDDRILYNSKTGALSYDSDGSSAAHAAVQFAILDNKAALTFQDFLVV